VKDAVLNEEDLNRALGQYSNSGRYREEYINEWVKKEILFQEAVKEGITNDSDYVRILEQSAKELAASLLIKKILAENPVEPTPEQLKEYFEVRKRDFVLNQDLYKINSIVFNNYENAVKFRSILLESEWTKALDAFRGDNSLLFSETGANYPEYKIQPILFYKTISALLPGEISIVLQKEPGKFAVVQLVGKIAAGEAPSFDLVEERVKEQYKIEKEKELIANYINTLIDDYEIEIKRYSE
jgi:hypothetical protein